MPSTNGSQLNPAAGSEWRGTQQPWQPSEPRRKTKEETVGKLQVADKKIQPLQGRSRWQTWIVCWYFFPPFSICPLHEMSEGVIPELFSSSPSLTQKNTIRLPQPLTLSVAAARSIKQTLNMDDQRSPSNPKPPTQTMIANSTGNVNTVKSCKQTDEYCFFCAHEDMSSVTGGVRLFSHQSSFNRQRKCGNMFPRLRLTWTQLSH